VLWRVGMWHDTVRLKHSTICTIYDSAAVMQRPFLYVFSAALLGAFLVGILSRGRLFQSTWLTKHDNEWQYNRDSRNYGLDEKQCEAAFPKYGLEVDRSVAFRRYDHIREEEVETGWRGDGIVRAMIYDNQV